MQRASAQQRGGGEKLRIANERAIAAVKRIARGESRHEEGLSESVLFTSSPGGTVGKAVRLAGRLTIQGLHWWLSENPTSYNISAASSLGIQPPRHHRTSAARAGHRRPHLLTAAVGSS